MQIAERAFHRDMINGAAVLKSEIGYNPIRFNQMVAEYGGVEAARRLLQGADGSEGFTALWEARRLDKSVEAYVLLPWFRGLFSDDDRETAYSRLERHGFDVEGFLRTSEERMPGWWEAGSVP